MTMTTDFSLRPATVGDLPAINAIYNHSVLHSTATYQTEPVTEAERATWFARHGGHHPVMVAEWQGQVVGWASLSTFRDRAAYDRTVEESVYVHQDHHRRGIGRALVRDLLKQAPAIGHHRVIATISADQEPSLALHRSLGFIDAGRLTEVGFKFGRWLDVAYLEFRV
jgi:phosphinothricin acetyltransferase